MTCKHFGRCGSCTLFDKSYDEQLHSKVSKIKDEFGYHDIDIIASKPSNFRYRAEFRIYHDSSGMRYAMNSFEKKILPIDECHIISTHIQKLMPKLLEELSLSELLSRKLFGVEFLTTTTDEAIITLLYHKRIDEVWKKEAQNIKIDANIIGRSRGVKIVLKDDFIYEKLTIAGQTYIYKILDSGFTQPNPKVNEKMIEWVLSHIDNTKDLLELYCGLGNFTLPLSKKFDKVLATEVSKASIKSALQNTELNDIKNIKFVRLSSEELVEALEGKREFNRLQNVTLSEYNFSHIFVDPPRAGVDDKTIEFLKQFENIIYISCNPTTLKRDLKKLDGYEIERFACFDQFAYTNHLECGVILKRR